MRFFDRKGWVFPLFIYFRMREESCMKKPLVPVALATSLLLQPLANLTPLYANAATDKKGIVQLWQEIPSGQKMPKGMTQKELNEKLYCRLNHTLTPATMDQNYNTYVNSCYVDDVLYLGESDAQFKVYVSGYEGWVDKQKASKVKLSFRVNDQEELVPEGTPNSRLKDYEYTVYTTARFLESDTSTSYPLARQTVLEETDYVKYEGDYVKSPEVFETSNEARSVAQGAIQSPSYYANEKGQLIHYISKNASQPNAYTKTVVGLAPSWMKSNTPYYSYDGIYFYQTLADIQPSGLGAVNESNPYYNYYQYVSVRSQSQLSGNQLDAYTNSKGYSSQPASTSLRSKDSQLVGMGSSFEASQSTHGVNQTLQYAMAIHESAFGRSSLSIRKNNLFGMNAADLDPSGQSTAFKNVEEGILYHADAYLSKGYTDPLSDSRYYGAHLGNKGSGMNVKYSSDPYWGEKIAGIYHQIDKSNQYADLNYYQLGIIESSDSVSIYQAPSSTSSVLYQLRNNYTKENFKHAPLLIVGETEDFYQVKTDTPLNAQGRPQFDSMYQWGNATGYVLKSAVDHVIDGTYVQSDEETTVLQKPAYLPTVSVKNEKKAVAEGTILVNSLKVRSGKGTTYASLGSLKKGQTVSILETGSEWHKISYNNQTGYVSATYVELKELNQNSSDASSNSSSNSNKNTKTGTVTADNLKVRTGAGTSHSLLGTLSKGTKVTIVEEGNSWHRIKYGSGYGYVSADYIKLTTDSDNSSTDSKHATISFKKDLEVELGSDVDLLKDVTVENVGDQGYILDVRQSTLDLTKPGTYQVEYVAKYGENFSNELTKTRKVIVKDTTAPVLTLKGDDVITLAIGDKYEEPGVSVTDNSGEIIKYKISNNQFDTSIQGVYRIVYTASDSSDNTSTVTREVRVQDPNAPILTLKGESFMVLRGGEAYEEPGYFAVDGNGKELKVAVIGAHFDYKKEGQYTIEYIAENAEGIRAMATRVVIVKDVPGYVPEKSPYIGTGKVTIDSVNVRAGRGTSYKSLGNLSKSETVNVYDLEDDWYRIEFNGGEGFVHAEYFEFIKQDDIPATPELPVSPNTEISPNLPSISTPQVDSTTDSEEQTSNENLMGDASNWVLPLSIGLGICLGGALVVSGLLIVRRSRRSKISTPTVSTIMEADIQDVSPLMQEDDDTSSFPHYY